MIWNFPEGIELGPLTIRFYSLMFVIAFGLGWYIMKPIFIREKIALEKLDSLFIWIVIATLLGARLGQVFFYDWAYFKENPLEILLPIKLEPSLHFTGFAGLASHGAAIGIIIAMYFFRKRVLEKPLLWILDRVVIPVSCGAVFVRLGNFFNSEIVGTQTTSSFGIRFIREHFRQEDAMALTKLKDVNSAYNAIATDPKFSDLLQQVPVKHPAQLYEAFCYIFVFAILLFLYWKTFYREKHGLIFGFFLTLLWTVRFVVEFVKEKQGGIEEIPLFDSFTTGQWLSFPFILVGLYFIFMAEKPLPDDLFDTSPTKLM